MFPPVYSSSEAPAIWSVIESTANVFFFFFYTRGRNPISFGSTFVILYLNGIIIAYSNTPLAEGNWLSHFHIPARVELTGI